MNNRNLLFFTIFAIGAVIILSGYFLSKDLKTQPFGVSQKISEMTALTSAAGNDLFAIVDTSETETKSISYDALMTSTTSLPTLAKLIGLTNASTTQLTVSGALWFPASSITNAMVGTNITTLGTITAGTWNGTPIVTSYGGTGLSAGLATSFIPYGAGTSPFATSSNLYFTTARNNLYALTASTTQLTVSSFLTIPYTAATSTPGLGSIFINTASSSLRYNDGGIKAIYPEITTGFSIASTSIWNTGATTTIPIGFASYHGETLTRIECRATTNAAGLEIGTGVASTSFISVTTTKSVTTATLDFNSGQSVYIGIGSLSARPDYLYCSRTRLIKAD